MGKYKKDYFICNYFCQELTARAAFSIYAVAIQALVVPVLGAMGRSSGRQFKEICQFNKPLRGDTGMQYFFTQIPKLLIFFLDIPILVIVALFLPSEEWP